MKPKAIVSPPRKAIKDADQAERQLRELLEAVGPLIEAGRSWRVHANIDTMRDMPLTCLDAAIAAYDKAKGGAQ